jgi:phosphoglycolate phosphatase
VSAPATRIVFDLDGTLVQTRVASWEVFHAVQAEFGLGWDDPETFYACFEGNFFASIRARIPDAAVAEALLTEFFRRLEDDYHPAIIPGMTTVARALASRATLAVLSSNVTSVIRRVLTENGLQFCFAHVFGGDVEPDKSEGLRRFLADAAQGVGRRCAAPYDEGGDAAAVTAADTVLVTDTVGDVEAGVAAGVRVVGVSWGMHSAERLREAGAEFVALWPQELVAYLRPADDGEHGACSSCDVSVRSTCHVAPETLVESADRPLLPVLDTRVVEPAHPRGLRRARRVASVPALTSPALSRVSREVEPSAAHESAAPERPAVVRPQADDEMRAAMRLIAASR